MPDLPDGSTETDPFPRTALSAAELDAALTARLAEIPSWDDPDGPVRLGFAMTEPHRLALDAAQRFLARNPNNVGTHTRFGQGTTGTRRLEREAVLALGGLMRAAAVDGYLTSGANEGTLAGLRVGRNALRAAGCRRIVVLGLTLTHHSVGKAAEILGVEHRALTPGPDWVLGPALLEEAFDALEAEAESPDGALDGVGAAGGAEGGAAGGAPVGVIVVSTAGYYNTGLVDPVDRISALLGRRTARPGGLRFFHHVDAAHGGMILPFTDPGVPFDFRNRYVHSMVLDPHKSGLMPYSCGVFLCRKGLLGHGAVQAPMSGFVDETVTGSRSGAMAAALWSLVFGLAADGYVRLFRDCLRVRDELAAAVLRADPDAVVLPSPGNTVLVVGFSFDEGRLPAGLREKYRLVGNRLPWTGPDGRTTDRLFHHFYAMPHITPAHIGQFEEHLAGAAALARTGGTTALPEAPHAKPGTESSPGTVPSPGPGTVPSALKGLRGSSACLRHLVVHPPGRRDPDDHPHAYSFHTFQNRAELGEQFRTRRWGTSAATGGELLVYAPDLDRPFENELFGVVSPDAFSLEVLDRHQQKLSLVGAAHFSLFEGTGPGSPLPVVLVNFHADGRFRSAEFKYGDRWYTDEIQVFRDTIVVKVGKDARSIRRSGDDYSFSLDTSLELRVTLVDGDAPPHAVRWSEHCDPALPRRRHLLRGQYSRFPNRFFDVIAELTVGRDFRGAVPAEELLRDAAQGSPPLARSAELDLVRVLPGFAAGRLVTALTSVADGREAELTVGLGFGTDLATTLTGPPVGSPEQLTPETVVDWAERLYPLVRTLRAPDTATAAAPAAPTEPTSDTATREGVRRRGPSTAPRPSAQAQAPDAWLDADAGTGARSGLGGGAA
ncbi:pyridoxal-dependent decarboxylase [Streptomyces liangshanensis]|uniref:Uncharacterized protein n=1 Tax=Streptomyces liangshanensis TaxID=2717324 RepID=A0A6G9H1Q5_9ACTN|nr:pyridoxal-dependent decarboxylase [Streptomyces liangshanensis]QIQ04458.1 hypothetical protein HA039_21060 [Streptomyces liangshanensis]